MITEDYVSFEIAKLLKEKGFDEPCNMGYNEKGQLIPLANWRNTALDKFEGVSTKVTVPTLQMAMKWLREVHNIKVNIFYNNSNYAIEYFEPNTQTGVGKFVFIGDGYHVYEQACEVAIKYCLENLI